MKIVLLGHRDIASNLAMSLLLSGAPRHRYRVMLSGPVQSPSVPVAALTRLAAYEARLCEELDGSASLKSHALMSFNAIARHTGHPIEDLAEPNSPAGLARLSQLEPDLVVSIRYRRILRDAAIAIPKLGVLNLHSGLLPEYKGMMATFWAMLNNEPQLGSTLHYVVDGTIDTGPVVARAHVPARPGRSYLANVLSLYPGGCQMLVDTLQRIEDGEAVGCHGQAAGGRYYPAPGCDDVQRFHDAGLRLFDGHEVQDLLVGC